MRKGAETVEEASLEPADSGLTPASEGWFVVNVREAAWLANEAFGGRCVFEAEPHMVRQAWKVFCGCLEAKFTQEVPMGHIRKNPAG